ncbi:hypothetical protein JBE04_01935 [Streptomyces sp. PRKS01-29]|nr:hypothetical protein [Streptomyces sabulosicollis]MBI0293288.1 hypothetical protein [Streptomyces sabulosicollis]
MTSTPRNARPRPTPRDLAPSEAAEPAQDDYYDDESVSDVEAQEIEANGHYVEAKLAGESIRVIPPGAWRQSWQARLAQGQFNAFAEQVVHPDDLDLYFEIDPTNDEFEQFVTDAASLSGESLGKSRGPNRSTRRTRRR